MGHEELGSILKDMLEAEKCMESTYNEISQLTANSRFNAIIKKIMHDEIRHEKNVNAIMEMISLP